MPFPRRSVRPPLRALLVLLVLLSGAAAVAQECRIEVEPNDTPAEAVPIAPYTCLVGDMAGQDQDAYVWEVDDAAAQRSWSIEILGIPGQLTKLDVLDVTFADNGVDVSGFDTLFSWGTQDGRPATSEPFLVRPGRYVVGVSSSGGEGQYVAHLRAGADLTRGRGRIDPEGSERGPHGVAGLVAEDVGWSWSLDEEQASLRWDVVLQGPVATTLELRVVDASGAEVGSARTDATGRASITSLGLATGEHRIDVLGSDGATPVAVDVLPRGRLTDGNEVEPNDDWATANVMDFARPFEGAGPGVDLLLVDVGPEQAGRAWDLVVDGGDDDRLEIELFDDQRRPLQRRRGSGGVLRGLVFDEGEYGIEIYAGESAYTLSFRPADDPEDGFEREPNDQLVGASPLSDDLTLRGTLWPQDFDLLSFDVQEDGLYRVQVIGDGVDHIYVRDANGVDVADVTGQRRLRLDNVALVPGRYAVAVDGDEGQYAVRVLRIGPIPPAPEPDPEEATADLSGSDRPAAADRDADARDVDAIVDPTPPPPDPGPPAPAGIVEQEPNDTPTDARVLAPGRIHVGTLPDARDGDTYRFTLLADRYVRIEWLPPEGGEVAFDTTEADRVASPAPGRAAVLQRWLVAGDYTVRGRAVEPADGWYRLRLTFLDALDLPDDLEPNDDLAEAIPLPADLVVDGSIDPAGDRDDSYLLPSFDRDVELTIAGDTDAIRNVWIYDAEGASTEVRRSDEGVLRTTVPGGEPYRIRLRGQGAYRAEFVFGAEVDPAQLRPPVGDDGVRLDLAASVSEVAAYGQEGQSVDATLTVTNDADEPRAVTFESAVSQWPVQVALPEPTELAPGEVRELPIRIDLPDDLRDDLDLAIQVGARSEAGLASTSLALAPRCEAPAVAPSTYFPVPEALLGHLNLLSDRFGAELQEELAADRGRYLSDGIAAPGRHAYVPPGGVVTYRLPGDRPWPLTGTLLNPQGGPVLDQLRRFEILTSMDGQTFTTAFEGHLDAPRLEQGFVFDAPIEARWVRLRFIDSHRPGAPTRDIGLGEWKVTTSDPSLADGIDLADVRNGGFLVWSDPIVGPNIVLPGQDGRTSFDGRRHDDATFVIGFEHGRAAQITGFAWEDGDRADPVANFRQVRIEASLFGPVGPWTEVSTWDLDHDVPGTFTADFETPVWARFVKVTALGHDRENASIWVPSSLRLFERSNDDDYRSILGQWGFARDLGPWEWRNGVDLPPDAIADDGSNDERGGATVLANGDRVRADVLVAEDQDWYRIDVPEGSNALSLTLQGEVDAIRYRLESEDGSSVAYDLAEIDRGVRLTAFVEPGSYFLHVDEPKRSVVYSWDTSGSVAPYEPLIYAAVRSFARDVDPEREFVQMLAFDAPSPVWLLPFWTGDPGTTTEALITFDRYGAESSNAEHAALIASRALAQREGTRALLLITDHESGGYDLTPELWAALDEARPRVYTFEVSTDGSGGTQDRMQAYAAVAGGQYTYGANVGDFDAGMRRAACQLRRAKGYTVAVAVAYQEPPGPGTLSVERGEGTTLPGVQVVFDASGSMGALLPDGTSRIDAAKQVLDTLVGEVLPEGTPFALRAFGHLTPQSCESRLEIPLAPLDREASFAAIDAIQPKLLSQTPIADALRQVAADLEGSQGGTVVLITDGEESCGGDPAAAVDELRAAGIDVNLSIVTLGVESEEVRAGFEALAQRAGGAFASADDTAALRAEVEAALYPTFEVLAPDGTVVATGRVGSGSVELPVGVYSVRVPGAPPTVVRDVRIRGDDAVTVELGSEDR